MAKDNTSAMLEVLTAKLAKMEAEASERNERIEQLSKALAQKDAERLTGLTIQVAKQGGVSVYGLQRSPVTLYRNQWERLNANMAKVMAFIKDNATKLSTGKDDPRFSAIREQIAKENSEREAARALDR
jgi:hypothetical protein